MVGLATNFFLSMMMLGKEKLQLLSMVVRLRASF